jgi:hypothetical protein
MGHGGGVLGWGRELETAWWGEGDHGRGGGGFSETITREGDTRPTSVSGQADRRGDRNIQTLSQVGVAHWPSEVHS